MLLFQKRYDKAKEIVESYLKKSSSPYISMSWGKDSIFLCYLIRELMPEIKVVYLNSGYALPDTYEIRDRLVDEWNLNYTEIKQEVDYIELSELIGLPHERSVGDQNRAVQMLKKKSLDAWAKGNGHDLCFWGIRADEAKKRQWLFKKYGYSVHTNDITKVHPIIHFRLNELWCTYEELNIPINQIYTKTKFLRREQIRNTGWVSTDGADSGKIMWLKYYYPEYFAKLMVKFPKIRSYV